MKNQTGVDVVCSDLNAVAVIARLLPIFKIPDRYE
jgi:hypothetical protein